MTPVPGANIDFYPTLLNNIVKAVDSGNTAIVACKDQKTSELSKVLVLVHVDEATRNVCFTPIARLYDSNPMEGIKMENSTAVLASQIPMRKWRELAEAKAFDSSKLN